MARMKFLCDAERCIECNGCVTACNNEHDVPWGINRRHVVTLKDGESGEKSISVACMHCTDAPCAAVCPVDCFYTTPDGIVLHDKDLCIGCGYCFYACPFGAPQFPEENAFGARGKMDKCTFCAGGPLPDRSVEEYQNVRTQPDCRGQTAAVRRDVRHQGPAGRRRQCRFRHLHPARHQARRQARHVGMGIRPTISNPTRRRTMKRTCHILTAFIVLAGLAGCSSESRSVTMHEPGVYKGAKDPLLAQAAAAGADRSLQAGANRSLKKGGVMATQTRKRTVSFLVVGALLLVLLSGVFYWQAVGADISNPRANFWRVVRQGVPGLHIDAVAGTHES